jgi:hypothetical protein
MMREQKNNEKRQTESKTFNAFSRVSSSSSLYTRLSPKTGNKKKRKTQGV